MIKLNQKIYLNQRLYLDIKNQISNAPGTSTTLKMKKFRYMSPAKFPTFKLIPKNTKAFTNL